MTDQFSRSRLIYGDAGVESLQNARVAVFGLGGVGGQVCEALVRTGLGSIDIIDHDVVDLTNLNRQIIATQNTVGMRKIDAMEKRLASITEILVPFMGILYVLVSLLIIFLNIRNVPGMFASIFRNAFDFQSVMGGFSGSCIMYGVKRGLYSNEAGMGSAPNAAATASVSHPAKQGLVQMLSVFIDTLLICTATAFMCLSTSVVPTEEIAGAVYVQNAIASTLGTAGPVFLAVAMMLFAFTTLLGNYSYCEGCLEFILHRSIKKHELLLFRLFATAIVFIGAIANAGLVWDTADMLQGMIVVVNVPTILILGGTAIRCLNDYVASRKRGENPVFHAKNIGIKEETDFWK